MKRLTILITMLILTACTAVPTPSPSPASTATLSPSPTATLTSTVAGTASPTEEPTSTPWPTHPPRPEPVPRPPITFEKENGLPPGAIARLGRGEFLNIELSPDGQQLGVGTTAGVSIYDALTFEERWFVSTGDWVNHVAISPDNTMIAGAIRDEVAVWDIQTGDRLHVLGPLDGDIHTMSWSPDSSRLFAGSYIGDPYIQFGMRDVVPFNTMMVWEIDSGESLYNLRSPDEDEMLEELDDKRLRLLDSAWSSDGRYLVVGAYYELYAMHTDFFIGAWLIWWDMDTGEQTGFRQWSTLSITTDEIIEKSRVSIHPEQNILAAATGRSPLFLDLETGQPVELGSGIDPDLHITGVYWPQQGDLFLTASNEVYKELAIITDGADTLRVWNVETGEDMGLLAQAQLNPDIYNNAMLYDYKWSPSGSEFAAAYKDWQVMIWNASTSELLHLFEDAGSALIWPPDGEKLITYSEANIKLWDLTTGQLLNTIETNRNVHAIDWSPDGKTIAAGTASRGPSWTLECNMNWWDVASSQLVQTITIQDEKIRGFIRSLDYGKTSSHLAAGMGATTGNGAYMMWDSPTQYPHVHKAFEDNQHRYSEGDTVWDVAWSPDETLVAIAVSDRVHLLDDLTGEISDTFEDVGYVVGWSPDGKRIITWNGADEHGKALLIDIETKEILLMLNIGDQYVTDFEWSPDGKIIAVSTGQWFYTPGRTYLFDAQTGEKLNVLSMPEDSWYPHELPMTGLVWLDNQMLITSTGVVPLDKAISVNNFDLGTFGGTILIWDVQTGEMLLELEGHNGEVQDLALSPDGSTLASASADGTVILWDVALIMAMIED